MNSTYNKDPNKKNLKNEKDDFLNKKFEYFSSKDVEKCKKSKLRAESHNINKIKKDDNEDKKEVVKNYKYPLTSRKVKNENDNIIKQSKNNNRNNNKKNYKP